MPRRRSAADVVVKVAAPDARGDRPAGPTRVLIGFLGPLTNGEGVRAIAATGATSFAMEAVPRISRAQSMDALSSQANISGYRSALIGAQELGRFYPMLMTAAGTIRPATVLVLGAGVAGLQAIATARRLGAWSRVSTCARGQGAGRVAGREVPGVRSRRRSGGRGRLRQGAHARAAGPPAGADGRGDRQVDVVITTALVPGRRAPILVTEQAVKLMKPGSVIVDLAGEAGGNCELSEPGESIIRHDVKILAPLNVPTHDGRARLAALRAQHPGAAGADDRRTGSCRSTSKTRSSPARASRVAARSFTTAPRRPRPLAPGGF